MKFNQYNLTHLYLFGVALIGLAVATAVMAALWAYDYLSPQGHIVAISFGLAALIGVGVAISIVRDYRRLTRHNRARFG